MFMFMQYVLECMSQCWPCNNLTAQDGVCGGASCCQVRLTKDMSNDYVFYDPQYKATIL